MESLYILVLVLGYLQIVESNVSWDPQCGITKGCFPDCRSQGCQYLVTWKDTGTGSLQFSLFLQHNTTPGYIAIGFSNDYRMGDDSVIGCVLSTGNCYSSYNSGTHNKALSPLSTGLGPSSVTMDNGIISWTFTRQFALSPAIHNFFDIKQNKYILMFVHGMTEMKKGFLSIDQHHMIPFASEGKVDFTSNNIVSARKWNTPLIKLHGMLMSSAWLFFSCVGIITARYNRQMLKRYRLFDSQIWFQVHRAVMLVVTCLVIAGFVTIFVEISGYSQLNPPPRLSATSSHPVLGIIVTSLSILNVVGGFLRPGTDHRHRWLFNWVHFCVGVFVQVLAVATVFIGFRMQRAALSMNVFYVGVVQVFITVVVCAAIEIHKWKTKKTADATYGGLSDPFVFNMRKTASEFYGYVLAGYIVVTLLLTLTNFGLIATS